DHYNERLGDSARHAHLPSALSVFPRCYKHVAPPERRIPQTAVWRCFRCFLQQSGPRVFPNMKRKSRVPAEATDLLDQLAANFPLLLGRNLVGIYLYGSITSAAFNSKRSDIDCIVVTRRRVGNNQFRKLGAWFEKTAKTNSWTTRLQISILAKSQLLVSS